MEPTPVPDLDRYSATSVGVATILISALFVAIGCLVSASMSQPVWQAAWLGVSMSAVATTSMAVLLVVSLRLSRERAWGVVVSMWTLLAGVLLFALGILLDYPVVFSVGASMVLAVVFAAMTVFWKEQIVSSNALEGNPHEGNPVEGMAGQA